MYLAGRYQDLMLARAMLDKGQLPKAGGWAEQPYHWVQALQVIGQQVAQVERERLERMRNRTTDE